MKILDYILAPIYTAFVLLSYLIFIPITLITAPLVALTAKKQYEHPMGKPIEETHSAKYLAKGASGEWEYYNSNVRFLKWWNNYEDGMWGEPSGKNSMRMRGKEHTKLSMFIWGIRNPFNWGKRTLPLFHCMVNECDIDYVGDYVVSDKVKSQSGKYFIKATHKVSKRKYYGFRWVKHCKSGKVRNFVIGYKLKPEHGDIIQPLDDADKAFTLRHPFKT